MLWHPDGHEVVARAGQSLGEMLMVQDTIAYWRDTAATALRILGADHPQTLVARHNLADWQGVAGDPGSLGIVIGGSGNGEQIAANKVRGIRAALAWNEETARLSREHNNANVISVGARMYSEEEATRIVEAFLTTPFSGAERHSRRIAQLATYETIGQLPSLPD